MTREEAVAYFKRHIDLYCVEGICREAEEMAIKALEQESCEDWYDIPSDEMTLEQARQAVKDLRKMWAEHLWKEPCDDAISRQAALDTFGLSEKSRKYGGDHSGYDTIMLCEVQDALEALPSVQPQPKTGHGEWVQYDYHPKLGNWHCSECRCVVIECIDKEEKGGIPLYKYCPQCGAKMVEPQESEGKE